MKHRFALLLGLLVLAILVLALLFADFFSQKSQQQVQRPQVTGTTISRSPISSSNSYPANIEYNNGGYGVYSQAALTNPHIGAVDVTMDWSKVEQQQGVFNWTPLDNELQAWGGAGKKLVIIIRYAAESGIRNGAGCPSSGLLPAWEASRIPTFCDSDVMTVIPDYFDATFQVDLKAFIKAIADHIAASPYKSDILFVRVGLGLGGEGYPLTNCTSRCNRADYQADVQQLVTWGLTAQNWLKWQEAMLTYVKSVFPYTTVIYGINQMFSPANNPLNFNPATGNPIQMDVAYFAAANGMGVGQQGLVPNYPNDYAKIKEILKYITQHYPNTFIQFATVDPISKTVNSACDASCIIQGDIQTAEQYRARSIDWWAQDDNDPSFQSYFAQWQQYVVNRYN